VPLLNDPAAAAAAAGRLSRQHRSSPMMGQTLLQRALPISFGLKAARWMVAIDEASDHVRSAPLAVQMGGPVGHRDPAIAARVSAAVNLEEPVLSWHTDRRRPAGLACALGVLAGTLAKVARDVTLSDHIREGTPNPDNPRGGSSAMAHKRNPVAAVSMLACAKRTPGLVATMLATMEQEHERAAGAWQAEWGTPTDLLRLTGSAAAWGRDLLENLEIDEAAMRAEVSGDAELGASMTLIDRALKARRR
jgi:3-carboxy-cis,cis-muconate cycloisomerase